ncbi:MAG TPA: ATPase, T2SS/T4P/T4SS family [Candidatus Norongarragalinales archaeon]|jgi:flagellar protein FlaI|nr:ATPase, T2SS/T4P/T4SS family [Candidatus Norongarragalinales archaeon]
MARIETNYPFSKYIVQSDSLTPKERKTAEAVKDLIGRKMDVSAFCRECGIDNDMHAKTILAKVDPTKVGRVLGESEKADFRLSVRELLATTDVDKERVARVVSSELFGFKLIQPLLEDDELEEIMVNGPGPVLVFHRKHGICECDVSFENDRDVRRLVEQLTSLSDRPLQDVKLPDGSRANIVLPPLVPHAAITIRKYRNKPLSVVDLVKEGTISPEVGGFLWVAIDGLRFFPLNVLVVGGSASGKTTMLNSFTAFIPPHERVVSLEETPELNLVGRKDWVQLEGGTAASLDDLLKNSLRMRPDRILVGEVRGREAETLFTAMNVGHRGLMSTIHANSDRDAVKRLENHPMNVPRSLIPLVDLVVVVNRVIDRKRGVIRRVMQVSEVSRIEDEIALNEVYHWNPVEDKIERTEVSSEAREKLCKACGISSEEFEEEVANRAQILQLMAERNVTDALSVNKFMAEFYGKLAKEETRFTR